MFHLKNNLLGKGETFTKPQGLPESPETNLKNRRTPTLPRDLISVNL